MKKVVFLISLCLVNFFGQAQNFDDWEIYPSYASISSLATGDDVIFSAAIGGIFTIIDGNIEEQINTLEGLHRSDPTSIAFDAGNQRLIAGYMDGMIDIIQFGENNIDIERLSDISRYDRFNSKTINDIKLYNNLIFVATDFGIVVYDGTSLLVTESFLKYSDFNIGSEVRRLSIYQDTLFVATADGIAIGFLQDNLADSQNWTVYGEEDGFSSLEIQDVEANKLGVFALVDNEVYQKNENSWSIYEPFNQTSINFISTDEEGETLLAARNRNLLTINSSGEQQSFRLDLKSNIKDVILTQNQIIAGTENEGVAIFDLDNESSSMVLPSGPSLNFFNDISVEEGTLIGTSTQSFPSSDPLNPLRGYYIFKDNTWNNYNRNTTEDLSNMGMVYSLSQNDSSYYFGSWGSGIVKHNKNNGNITVYNRENSNLLGLSSSPGFVVISGLSADAQGNMWALSLGSDSPLYVQIQGTEEWLPFSSEVNNDLYFDIFIDSYDQKWISLLNDSQQGRGLLVVDTGDPQEPNDDNSVRLTTDNANGNLPDSKVKAVIEDKNNEVWIGTERGIARFIFPNLILEGGASERQAQWLINEDTTASSRFLLRDINVSAMDVNAENQKWVGSVNQGLWLLNAEGSRIEKRFTKENSNLISDNILSISVNDNTGEVFVGTDLGLVSFQDVPKVPEQNMSSLKVFPNPFKYSEHQQIIIEGLGASKKIKVLGVDGMVVKELEALGGRTSWDGYGYNGQKLGTGVYLIVAYDNNESAIGKVVIGN